jgi:hypothetical protein
MAADEAMKMAPGASGENPYDGFRRALAKIRQMPGGSGEAFGEELADGRGEDFDLSEVRTNAAVLDILERTGVMLGREFAASGAAVNDDAVAELKAALRGAIKDAPAVAHGMRELSYLTAKGAASLEPNAVRRIQERMRHLGDALARQVEDRIAVAATRDDRTQLKALRDEMRAWRAERDASVQAAQPLVDEFTIRIRALRNECLMQADRLARAADLLEDAARDSKSSSDGASGRALRGFLLRARIDMKAPLHSVATMMG